MNESEKIELKPCPFCGSRAIIQRVSSGTTHDGWTDTWRVECINCGASPCKIGRDSFITRDKNGNVVVEKDGRAKAISDWNKRPSEESIKPVFYLCDKKQCTICNYPICKHTRDIAHAKNFKILEGFTNPDKNTYWEMEADNDM